MCFKFPLKTQLFTKNTLCVTSKPPGEVMHRLQKRFSFTTTTTYCIKEFLMRLSFCLPAVTEEKNLEKALVLHLGCSGK